MTGTATDAAGNTASTSVPRISIDKTAPTVTGAPTTAPNGAGWYQGNVAVALDVHRCALGTRRRVPGNTTISGEGTARTSSVSVTDRAGNTTNATSSPAVKIDGTAPVTSASAVPVWNNTDVTVTLTASDALSGVSRPTGRSTVAPTTRERAFPVTTEGDHTLTFFSVDNAGNTEATHTIHVRIDKTPPTIATRKSPAANGNGWNNTQCRR